MYLVIAVDSISFQLPITQLRISAQHRQLQRQPRLVPLAAAREGARPRADARAPPRHQVHRRRPAARRPQGRHSRGRAQARPQGRLARQPQRGGPRQRRVIAGSFFIQSIAEWQVVFAVEQFEGRN